MRRLTSVRVVFLAVLRAQGSRLRELEERFRVELALEDPSPYSNRRRAEMIESKVRELDACERSLSGLVCCLPGWRRGMRCSSVLCCLSCCPLQVGRA